MTDYDMGFGDDDVNPDMEIDLDFSDVEELAPRIIVDQGIYSLFAKDVDVQLTKKTPANGNVGELMVIIPWSIEDDEKWEGAEITDHLTLPGAFRKENNRKTWNLMMNLWRDAIQAITGQEVQAKFKPKEMIPGRVVRAAVIQEGSNYRNKKGELKFGVNNTIGRYFPSGEPEQFNFFPVAIPTADAPTSAAVAGQQTTQTGFQV